MIINNEEFLVKEIPQYHPSSQKYLSFWREEKRKCIEGYWVSGKYMPGKLYYHTNFGTIKRNIGKSKVKSYARPLLRDIEWQLFLNWTEARGFSGFKGDLTHSSLELVKLWRDEGVDEPTEWITQNYPDAVNPSTGKLKYYITPREALRKIYEEDKGRALFDNSSKNIFILGARGFGKSYSVGGIISHEYLFDGLTSYNFGELPTAAEIVVGAGDAKYSSETLDKVKTMLEKLPGSQELNNIYYPSPFYKRYSGTWAPASQITATYKKKIGNNWIPVGTKSNIKHRTFKDNPFAANGTRPGVMIFEEVGFFHNLKESYAASVECQREGSYKFGSMAFIGTGGNMEGGGTIDAQEIFYNPVNYDCMEFEDEWEFRGKIGYFVPAYMGLHDYINADGSINIVAAKAYLEKEREKLRTTKGSSTSLEGEMINRPLVPSEMFLQRMGTMFPIPELRDRLSKLEQGDGKLLSLLEKRIELFFNPEAYNGVDYKIDTQKKLQPINVFPWKETNKEGCVVAYELPQYINNKVPEGAYIIGCDPYGSDDPNGESLGSIIVLKTKKHFSSIGHDEIVAVYYGRPYQGREIFNQTLYKLCLFYGNAKIYFENIRGNVKEYFEKIKRLHLLAHKPQTVLTKKASFVSGPTLEYGYPMSSRDMKLEGAQYIRDWLLEARSVDNTGKTLRNLDLIQDRFLLQQLIAFNLEGNFDAVMGFMGCMIGINETYNQYEKSLTSGIEEGLQKLNKEIDKILVNNNKLFLNKNLTLENGAYRR